MQNSTRSVSATPPGTGSMRTPSPAKGNELSIGLRIGLPLFLAALAAGLNVASVRKQIAPIEAYTFVDDLPAGARLTPANLKVVEVAGDIDRSQLIKPVDLRRTGDAKSELTSLEAGLSARPRILSRPMAKGELLTKASLGGRASAANNEELIQVPRTLIRGQGLELKPGQDVFFLAKKRSASDDNQEPLEIGPFRVALAEPTAPSENTSAAQSTIPLIYPLKADGTPVAAAKVLRTVVLSEGNYTLAIIEKASRR